jgi:hypothetical protein
MAIGGGRLGGRGGGIGAALAIIFFSLSLIPFYLSLLSLSFPKTTEKNKPNVEKKAKK